MASFLHSPRVSASAPSTPRAPLSPVFPLMVAITADAAATAALHTAHALAHEHGAIPTVLRVVHEDLAVEAATTGAMGGVPEGALDPAYRTTQRTALERQVHHVLGELPPWRYEIDVGATVPTIVARTRELRAELVILGLPQHNFFRRAFVRDTVQGIIEQTEAAVLAVRPELMHRPESILVAMDFGPSSVRAAHVACQLVAPGGHVILAYVQPDATDRTPDSIAAPDTALTLLLDELSSQKAITVTSVIEHGNPITGVEEIARRTQPDVVALGARNHSAVDWFFGDSVLTNLVTERRWSLLVVPE